MFGDGSLTFREFAMREPLPLAMIHDAVLEFLRGRTDAVLFGAQAVNAYVDEPRMTSGCRYLVAAGGGIGGGIGAHLSEKISNRGADSCGGGWSVASVVPEFARCETVTLSTSGEWRTLPGPRVIEDVSVTPPGDLIAQKVLSTVSRSKSAKGLIDHADIRRLLLTFPRMKALVEPSPIASGFRAFGRSP